MRLSDHAARNRDVWNQDAENWVESGSKSWASPTPWWGMWEIPEEEVRLLPDVTGLDVVDLGCGTGYWCAWFSRLGANPTGLDLSEKQLETARELQREHGIDLPLIHASAEDPPLPDESFDLVFSEYGAAIWCDPTVWIPEAYRLLRPVGETLVLERMHELYAPDGDRRALLLHPPRLGAEVAVRGSLGRMPYMT
jgi:SAM-dependent methyltransferase